MQILGITFKCSGTVKFILISLRIRPVLWIHAQNGWWMHLSPSSLHQNMLKYSTELIMLLQTTSTMGARSGYGTATNRQVAGSIPDGVVVVFQWHNPSGCTVALESIQPLTEMSTRCISWEWRRPVRKADNFTTIPCRCHEIWEP
jgi:hypothetical protein